MNQDVIQRMAASIIEKQINSAMSDVWTTSTIDDDSFSDKGTLTLDKLFEATRRVRAMPPIARFIYFVDRPAQYAHLMDSCVPDIPDLRLPNVNHIFGVRVIPINGMGDLTGLPECCKTPGIWAEMSDGTYKRLDND